jgi:hypothetical protein
MDTAIARDTDIIREYLAALDVGERGLSPFGKLATTIKLARLRRELNASQVESTEEDLAALRRELGERINRSALRRFVARPWGSRIAVFALLIVGQQLALAALWFLTRLFIRFAPVPKRWNPVLPHEQPGFLYSFVFVAFFATPMLATLVVFGGRYFRAWRQTLPITVLLVVASVLATILVLRKPEQTNPVRHHTSLEEFARVREQTVPAYREWTGNVWLLRDPEFQRDYETYLRNGPGRWITSRLVSEDDQAWLTRNDDSDSLKVMGAYLDSGQDQNGFREWLKYYLDRHRIYSSDRIDQEVSTITGSANQRYLGLWQMEPFLKERDQRLYRAYLGSVDQAMKRWGLAWMGLLAVLFLGCYLAATTFRSLAKGSLLGGATKLVGPDTTGATRTGGEYAFPERNEIITTPFFSSPLKLFSKIHVSFLRFAVLSSVVVFAFWAAIYAFALTGERADPVSQVALIRSNVLFPGMGERANPPGWSMKATTTSVTYTTVGRLARPATAASQTRDAGIPGPQVGDLEKQMEESDYQTSRQFKDQYQTLAAQRSELNSVKSLTAQLQQTTTSLPEQLNDLGSRASAAEARAGQVGSEAEAARQAAEQASTKLKDVEARTARAADQVGRVESQISMLATRTESMDKEFEQRARQIEARTEELGERTEGLKENGERIERIQRIAFAAILSELNATTDDLDRRVTTSFYRFINKSEAHQEADMLLKRIASLTSELRELKTEQAGVWIAELDALTKRVEDIAARIK